MINILLSQELGEATERLILGLIIFGVLVFAAGIVISVCYMIKFFNAGNKYLKDAKQTQKGIDNIKKLKAERAKKKTAKTKSKRKDKK